MKVMKMLIENGNKATVELKSLANMPFRWEMTSPSNDIDTEMDVVPLRQSGGPKLKSVFCLKAKKPGTYTVEFALSAPFVGAPISRKKYEITFK